jgi:hypothetical protein
MRCYEPIQRLDQGGSTYGEMVERDDGDYVFVEDFEKMRRAIGVALELIADDSRADRMKEIHAVLQQAFVDSE